MGAARKAYGSRAEVDLQQNMYDFECAAQPPIESIRERAMRLERQITELNVMAKEAAKLKIAGYNESRDVAVYASSHKCRLANVSIEEQSQEAVMATLRIASTGQEPKIKHTQKNTLRVKPVLHNYTKFEKHLT
jgi:hypothetical protein